MTYQERINAKAAEIEALTSYANGVTGKTDTSIGDAIRTLCDGYGSGGAEEGIISVDTEASEVTLPVSTNANNCIIMKQGARTGFGKRAFIGLCYIQSFDANLAIITNSSGSSLSINYPTTGAQWDPSTKKVKITNASGLGNFVIGEYAYAVF